MEIDELLQNLSSFQKAVYASAFRLVRSSRLDFIIDPRYYKVHHSTETVMVKVQDDILRAIDSNEAVVLLMLDLSAAFDTVSHETLLDRLSQCYGITGSVREWFASYLSSRTQFVQWLKS